MDFKEPAIKEAISDMAKYLNQNLKSESPFVLFTACNHIKSVIVYYAIIQIGKIAVLVDPSFKLFDITEIIDDVEPGAIIYINTQTLSFDYTHEIILRNQKKNLSICSDLKDVCTLAYTNAEDGFYKGAMITWQNLLAQINMYVQSTKIKEDSVNCALLPFSHLYGLINGIIVPTHTGGSNVIQELNLFKISEIMSELHNYKVEYLYSIPTVYYLLSKVTNIKDLAFNLKFVVSAATPLSPFIFESFYQKTNIKIREGYGLTECAPAVALNSEPSDIIKTSFGKAMPGCSVKIVDDDNKECEIGNKGEICVRGENIFKGYFNYEKATKEVLQNDWFHTGDYGTIDERGYLYFRGLKKNMINVGGNKIYPKWLERMVGNHENVQSSQVFNENSIIQGQSAGIKIRLKNNTIKQQEAVRSWCFNNINNNLLPRTWLFE